MWKIVKLFSVNDPQYTIAIFKANLIYYLRRLIYFKKNTTINNKQINCTENKKTCIFPYTLGWPKNLFFFCKMLQNIWANPIDPQQIHFHV